MSSGVPAISFCIPVFNAAKTIERCLRSVIAQNMPSQEILVVDNASTDDTATIARRILDGVPGARVVVNEQNLGRIENWNRCLELATGRYLKFALVNDLLLPGSAAVLLREAESHPGTKLVCSQPRYVNELPSAPEPMSANLPVRRLETKEALLNFSEKGNDSGGLNGILIDGETVRKHQLRFRPDLPFWGDFYFTVQVVAHGGAAYVEGESYLFDNGVKGRFTHAGLNNRKYYFEARECARLLAGLLPAHGAKRVQGFDFLCRQYTGQSFNYGLQPLSYWDTLRLFYRACPYRRRALKFRFGKTLERGDFYLKRLASKLGLYRYPWENNAKPQ